MWERRGAHTVGPVQWGYKNYQIVYWQYIVRIKGRVANIPNKRWRRVEVSRERCLWGDKDKLGICLLIRDNRNGILKYH